MFVSTAAAMTTQPLVKKEPHEDDMMSTPIYPTGMCIYLDLCVYTVNKLRQPKFCTHVCTSSSA